jgi:hypothetical protein
MARASRFSILLSSLILAVFAGIGIAKAQWQCTDPRGGPCSAPVGGNSGGRPSTPIDRPPRQPSEKEIEWERKNALYDATWSQAQNASNSRNYAEALRLFLAAQALRNGRHVKHSIAITQGNIALSAGDRHAALKYYEAAASICLKCWDDPKEARNFILNLRKKLAAEDQAARERAAAEQRAEQERVAAAQVIRNAVSKAVDSLDSLGVSGGGNASGGSPGGLTFIGPDSPEGSATVTNAMEQASSTAKSSGEAPHARNIEDAKRLSDCGIDTKPCAQPDHIQVPRPAQTPATADLLAHIPDNDKTRNDPVIRQSVAWYQTLDAQRMETEGKLAEVQKQIDSGKGDPATLNAEKGTLTNQLNDRKKLQEMAEDEIKKQLVNIHAAWIEQPPQAASKTTGKP